MQESLTISYTDPTNGDRSPETLIMLEQVNFANYTGYVTKAAMVNFIANSIYGTKKSVRIDCGLSGINCLLHINAYPYFPDLNYQLLCSFGTLSEAVVEEVEKTETIQLHLESNVTVKYPVLEVISAKWLNDAYDAELNLISPPPAIVVGDDVKSVSATTPCYGSVSVTYKTIVHHYVLTIIPRATGTNKYTSVVFAVYDGGLVYLETNAPAGAEDNQGKCDWGDNVNINPLPHRKKKPDPEYADKVIRINYCTQKKISEIILSY